MRQPPLGAKAQQNTTAACPVRVRRQDQSLVAHTRAVRVPPLGAKAQSTQPNTPASCPANVRVQRQDQSLVAHTRAVLSSDPVTRVVPSGEKAQHHTSSSCPVRVRRQDQSLVAHTRAVQSADPVTRVPPSGEKAQHVTTAACPVRVRRQDHEAAQKGPVASGPHARAILTPSNQGVAIGCESAAYPAWPSVQVPYGAH
eukprot:1195442-Prorocentrum_minimum.AAC.1